jgi:hypothetical protein
MFDIIKFLQYLEAAILNINQEIYEIPTTYESKGIQRERIFCSELSFQYRKLFEDKFPYKLHSEINKSGHKDFGELIKNIDPDFIFHTPGTHNDNFVIIEVKGNLSNRNLIYKDFEKIFNVMDDEVVHYKFGIFLLYNHSFQELQLKISNLIENLDSKYDKRIFVICSPESGDIEIRNLCDLR